MRDDWIPDARLLMAMETLYRVHLDFSAVRRVNVASAAVYADPVTLKLLRQYFMQDDDGVVIFRRRGEWCLLN